jgi:hypothetical protein
MGSGSGSGIRDPGSEFRDLRSGIRKKPIPDPGVKKAPDPGSATLLIFVTFLPPVRKGRFRILDWRPPPPPPPPPLGTPRRRPAEGRQARCRDPPDSWPREKHRGAVECSSVKPYVMNLLTEEGGRAVSKSPH